jgi:hypothetical protein
MTELANRADLSELEARFDHHDIEQARDPFSVYRALRPQCPVARSEQQGGFWAVLSYVENEEAFRDHGRFSSETVQVPRGEEWAFPAMPPVTFDPPRHRQLRKLLQPSFSPARVARLEPEIRARAISSIEEVLAGGKADGSKQYGLPIAINAVVYLLGVPLADEGLFAHWVDALVNVHGAADREGSLRAAQEMMQYFTGLIAEHRENPKDDLLSLILEDEEHGVDLTEPELYGLVFLFLTAGLDTAWKVIASSLHHLATHDDDRRRLVAQPELIPAACEEFLRFYAPTLMGRVATQDTELGGRQIRRGDLLLLCNGAANRDPAVFHDPEKFIVDRDDARHISFGSGVHRCIGAPIGQLEVRIALEEWLKRIPEFRLADPDAVQWIPGPIWGAYNVDLEWDTP